MKYYAVKNGRIPGVYTSWSECEIQVKGFSGAVYKSFSSKEEAESFLGYKYSEMIKNESDIPYAFVDGSYNSNTYFYGYGGFLVVDGVKHYIQGSGNKVELASMRNVAGEICGVIQAIKMAMSMNLKELIIYYDYTGLEAWANGTWKTNKEYTAKYARCVAKAREIMNIKFVKVPAHKGISGNEEADKLAKEAVGIY